MSKKYRCLKCRSRLFKVDVSDDNKIAIIRCHKCNDVFAKVFKEEKYKELREAENGKGKKESGKSEGSTEATKGNKETEQRGITGDKDRQYNPEQTDKS